MFSGDLTGRITKNPFPTAPPLKTSCVRPWFFGHRPASFRCGVARAPWGGRFARPVGQRAGRSRRPFHCDSQRGEFAAPWPRFSTSHDALRFSCSYGFGLKRSILWVKMVDFPLCRCHHCMIVIA